MKSGAVSYLQDGNDIEIRILTDRDLNLDYISSSITDLGPKIFNEERGCSQGRFITSNIGKKAFTCSFSSFGIDQDRLLQAIDALLEIFQKDLEVQKLATSEQLLKSIVVERIETPLGRKEEKCGMMIQRLWTHIVEATRDEIELVDLRIQKYSTQTEINARHFALRRFLTLVKRHVGGKGNITKADISAYELQLERLIDIILEKIDSQYETLRLGKDIYLPDTEKEDQGKTTDTKTQDFSSATLFLLGYDLNEEFGTGYSKSQMGSFTNTKDFACFVLKQPVLYRTYFAPGDIGRPESSYTYGYRHVEDDAMDFRGAVLLKALHVLYEIDPENAKLGIERRGRYDEGRVLPAKEGGLSFLEDEIESVIILSSGPETPGIEEYERLYPLYRGKFRLPNVDQSLALI